MLFLVKYYIFYFISEKLFLCSWRWKLRGGFSSYDSPRKLHSSTEIKKDRVNVFMRVGRTVHAGCGRRTLALLNFLPSLCLLLLLSFWPFFFISSCPSPIFTSSRPMNTRDERFKIVITEVVTWRMEFSFFFNK